METIQQMHSILETMVGKNIRVALEGIPDSRFSGKLYRREDEYHPFGLAEPSGRHVILHRSLRADVTEISEGTSA